VKKEERWKVGFFVIKKQRKEVEHGLYCTDE
jgi:hypothetical protein